MLKGAAVMDAPAERPAPQDMYEKPPQPAQHQQPPGLESEMDPLPRWKGTWYRPAGKLRGCVAVITGGDSGIGRSVAYHYACEGADVAITALPEERSDAETVRQAIEEEGRRCLVLEGDLRERAFCDRVVQEAVREFGRIDVLVHNAAWQNRKPVTELSEGELERTLETNVGAYLRLVRAATPHMKPGSCIVATGSIVGLEGSPKLPDYGATKGAIHAITRSLAQELIGKGIRVNCVAPGPVWTPLNPSDMGLSAEQVAHFGESNPMGRPAQPEEIAPAFVFLASSADSSFINGVVLPVCGEPANG